MMAGNANTLQPQDQRCLPGRSKVVSDRAVIHHEDGSGRAKVRIVDINRSGASVLSWKPFSAGSIVYFRVVDFQLGGFALVRYCRMKWYGRCQIGLEFQGELMTTMPGAWKVRRVTG